ncbi:MAG: hypothetical protein NTY83_00120, partial [Candidatus Micrarchaeota archaeon]|nr:hypothetical protein [Candidatus Micrarchaeota archaeon]
ERALVEWAIDECLDRANPDNSCALLRLDGEGRVVSENVDGKKLVSIVLGLAGNERIAEGVRVKAVEATTACQHVGRGELSDTLAELLEKEGVPQVLKGAVDKALEICGAQKFVQECSGKGLEELVGMRVTAGANERRFVDAAILERLRKLGVDGCVEELAGFLERKDLTPRLRAAGENAILEAVDMRGGGERADALLELLKRDLAPRVHIKIIDNVGGSPHADRAKLIDALAGVLGKKGIGKELKEAAEKALDAPVEECIKKGGADIGAVAILFREKGIPWSVLNRIMEACAKTDHFTKVAHVFMKEGLPQESAKIAESVLLERIDFFAERALRGGDEKAEKRMGLVVHLLWEKRLPESVYNA